MIVNFKLIIGDGMCRRYYEYIVWYFIVVVGYFIVVDILINLFLKLYLCVCLFLFVIR